MRVKEEQSEDAARPQAPAAAPAPPQMTPARVLAMQQSAGNQAVGRMIARFPDTAVRERASTVGDWVEAKIQVRAHEIFTETNRADEQANYFQARREVEEAWANLERLEGGNIITVDEWVLMKKGLSTQEYLRAMRAFNDWTGNPADKEQFLQDLPPDKMYLFTDAIARRPMAAGETIAGQIRGSANPDRAKRAQRELRPIANSNRASRQRLPDNLFALLVWGVAYARSEDATIGTEGIIGIHHAVEAAHALVEMPQEAYLEIVMQLDLTGGEGAEGDWDQRRVESVLILKGVAARRAEFAAGNQDARDDVTAFADDIRGEDTEDLVDSTTLRDSGSGGLQQRFTMTCSPTTVQIVSGEGDPIYARALSSISRHGLDYENEVADQQESMLNKAVAPRLLQPRWVAFQRAISGLRVTRQAATEWRALLDWMAGNSVDATLLAAGRGHATALGFTDDELDDFERYQIGLTTQPGLSFNEVDALVMNMPDIAVAGAARHDFRRGAVDDAVLDQVWARLYRGIDVPLVVIWIAGGGHAMSFTDARGRPPHGGSGREFLLSDPWDGSSRWMTADDVKSGNFSSPAYVAQLHY